MKKPSSGTKPQINKRNNESEFYEDFVHPSGSLSSFLFIPRIGEFAIALRGTETIVCYKPEDRIGFILWLWKHDVVDNWLVCSAGVSNGA